MNRIAWSLSGAVLAGGESRRMGRDKSILEWQGEPMWLHQRSVLCQIGARAVSIVRKRGQPPLEGAASLLHDAVDGAGPLAGLHAALTACQTQWVAVLAVDMPNIDAGWFRRLAEFCQTGTGAVARTPNGFEPLAAIYPRIALAKATSHLRAQTLSLQCLMTTLLRAGQMTAVSLPAAERRRTFNWNFPADAGS